MPLTIITVGGHFLFLGAQVQHTEHPGEYLAFLLPLKRYNIKQQIHMVCYSDTIPRQTAYLLFANATNELTETTNIAVIVEE